MKKIYIVLGFFLSVCSSYAQISSSVKIDLDSIGIGDPVKVYIEIISPSDQYISSIDYSGYDKIKSLENIQLQDSTDYFAELEWEGKYQNNSYNNRTLSPSSFINQNSSYLFRDTLNFRIWDYGNFIMPHPILRLKDSLLSVRAFESPRVLVSFPQDIINPDTSSLILPIKDIIRESKSVSDYLWIGYILLAAILLYVFLKIAKNKDNTKEEKKLDEVRLPSHLIASDKLKQLDEAQLWQEGSIKEYQSRLTFIIREYLEKRFRIKALESTTDEIRNGLKKLILTPEMVSELMEILQIADLVKFAKANPPDNIHQDFLLRAKQFVEDTKAEMTEEQELTIIQEYNKYLKELEAQKTKKS